MEGTLTNVARKSLPVDTRCIAEAAAVEIRECMETPKGTPSDLLGAYSILKRWY